MRRLILLLLMLTFSMCQEVSVRSEDSAGAVTMLCLNVGKADCILLNVEQKYYLIDTGYKRTSDQLLAMLEQEGVDRLSGVFLTHNHKDHYGGLNALCAGSIPIDAFYAPVYCADGTGAKHPAVIAAAKRGQTVVWLQAGDTIQISDTAFFDILAPVKLNKENENNNSLVMRLESSDGSILLAGDMKFEEEYELIRSDVLKENNVLKVAFHGDNTSTSGSFLSIVKPRVAVISTSSKEEKDTPSKDILYRLASVGCKTYVTQDAPYAVRTILSEGRIEVTVEDWHADD